MRAAFLCILLLGSLFAKGPQVSAPQLLYQAKESYFFRPAVANDEYVVFGYLGKVKPTRQEVEEERKRLQQIIKGTIKREYGSWENYKKVTERQGKEVGRQYTKETPAWTQAILPPSVVEKAVPLLLQGALAFAMYSGTSSEPIGNVGKTGIVIIDRDGHVRRVQLAINEPVEYIELHPSKPWALVLCDASYEDQNRYHTVGHILLVDLEKGTIKREWIFANATDQVGFTPDDKIAFVVQNPKHWSDRALRFIDVKTGKLLPQSLYPMARGSFIDKSGVLKFPKRFGFWRDLLIVSVPKGWDIYRYPSLQRIGHIVSGRQFLALAKEHPWLLNDLGCIWDIQKVRKLVCLRPKEREFVGGMFVAHDGKVVAANMFSFVGLYDVRSGTRIAHDTHPYHRGNVFATDKEGRYIFAGKGGSGRKLIRVMGVRRNLVGVNVFTNTLRFVAHVEPAGGDTTLSYAVRGDTLYLGGVKAIYRYRFK